MGFPLWTNQHGLADIVKVNLLLILSTLFIFTTRYNLQCYYALILYSTKYLHVSKLHFFFILYTYFFFIQYKDVRVFKMVSGV